MGATSDLATEKQHVEQEARGISVPAQQPLGV